jgi:hypothetical protein
MEFVLAMKDFKEAKQISHLVLNSNHSLILLFAVSFIKMFFNG